MVSINLNRQWRRFYIVHNMLLQQHIHSLVGGWVGRDYLLYYD